LTAQVFRAAGYKVGLRHAARGQRTLPLRVSMDTTFRDQGMERRQVSPGEAGPGQAHTTSDASEGSG